MEPELLAAYGYEIPEPRGVRDKLVASTDSIVASIRMITMLSERKLDCLAEKFIFVLAPVRAAESQELVTTIRTDYLHIDGNVAGLMMSTLLISVTTLVILVYTHRQINSVHGSAAQRFAEGQKTFMFSRRDEDITPPVSAREC
eukprot:4602835-Amphidinium_carterae.1